jgi:hypothetical protein
MKQVVASPELLVLDDFLEPEEFKFLWAEIQATEFESVHRLSWVNAWRLTDGAPLRGPVALSHHTGTDRRSPVYPTGTAVDLVFESILRIQSDLEPWIGRYGTDWSRFFCRPYLYPLGAGLSWHRDDQNSTAGAFTLYCHPTWNAEWGGELLVAGPESRSLEFRETELYGAERRRLGTHLDNSTENAALLENGFGSYVLPKPNRLAVVAAGVLHTIRKVDAAAGDRVRASLQGTFMLSPTDLAI